MRNSCIKINELDNVAVAVRDLKKGEYIFDNLQINNDIPQAHKIALQDIKEGEAIIRYGVELGFALKDINKGDWINENMLKLPVPPKLEDLKFSTNIAKELPKPKIKTFEGYKNKEGEYAGTRNILAISTTVQCVSGVLNIAVKKIKNDILPKYSNVDDVVAINHAYGCGVAINAKNADIPIRSLKNLIKNPNFGNEVMLIGLGCEKLTTDMLIEGNLI